MPRRWCLLVKMLKVLSKKSPSSRVNLQRRARLERLPRKSSVACPTRWLMVHND
jgi:hypothetical protein